MSGIRNKTIILAVSLLLLGVSAFYYGHTGIKEAGSRGMDIDIGRAGEVRELTLWIDGLAGGAVSGSAGSVRWWKSEEDGRYYFFLPAAAARKKLYLNMSGADRIYLDGKMIENGGVFDAGPGEYKLTTKEGTVYPLVVLRSSNLDALFLETKTPEDGAGEGLDYLKLSRENQLAAEAVMIGAGGGLTYRGEVEYLRGRGNATWEETDKKSYLMKLKKKADIAGMGEAKKWVLIPNSFDRSFLKNYMTYNIARKINLPFTPETVFVDWYVDGEYQGNYMLCEKIEVKENRVEIRSLEEETRLRNGKSALEEFPAYANGENGEAYTSKGFDIPANPADITGGYLLELEMNGRYREEETAGFVTANHEEIMIASPAYASREQVNYISTYYEETEAAILAADGVNPDTGKAFTDYLDVESFAKKYIIEELSKNVDAGLSSQYMFKLPDGRGGRLFAGPVWDYDSAWGLGGERYGVSLSEPDTFYANIEMEESSLWSGLYKQPVFYYYVCYFYQNEVLPAAREEFHVFMDRYADWIEDSVVMNFYRWGIAEGENVDEKKDTFRGRVESVRSFADERMEFLAKEWRLE